VEVPIVDLDRERLEENEQGGEEEPDRPTGRVPDEKDANQGGEAHEEVRHSDLQSSLYRRLETPVTTSYSI
jgi:hypothetical protein